MPLCFLARARSVYKYLAEAFPVKHLVGTAVNWKKLSMIAECGSYSLPKDVTL